MSTKIHPDPEFHGVTTFQVSRRELIRCGVGSAIGALVSVAAVPEASARSGSVVVETASGKVRGISQNGIRAFKGIPYGDSTAGNNRFRPPQAVASWAGIRDATQLGHPCFQTNEDPPAWLDPMPPSEDCLVLNVWTPTSASRSSRLPVMVWIHGGGYTFGSAGAPLYDCGRLARAGNIVTVGINHRLQAFGYTDLSFVGGEEFADSGNAGQLDILAALHWVRTNIEVFGGDPGNVTVFGQSGGGAKISALMGSPSANGLFHKAIIESGSVFRYRGHDESKAMSERMFSILGIRKGDLRALQAVPAATLLKCGDQIMSEAVGTGHPALKYAPVVDSPFLPDRPWNTTAPPGAANIPMLLGTTLDETILYFNEKERRSPLDDEGMARAITGAATVYTPDQNRVAGLIDSYRKALPATKTMEMMVRISTDIGFWKYAVHQAEIQSGSGAPVFMYRCDWKTPCCGGMWAPHGVELPFVMGIRHYGPAWDGKDSDAARAAADPHNLRFQVGDRILNAWVQFARSGNPSLPSNQWPRYSAGSRSTMIFDGHTQVVNDPAAEFRSLVKDV